MTYTDRVVRGGAWGYGASYVRVSYRTDVNAERAYGSLGFRLVRLINSDSSNRVIRGGGWPYSVSRVSLRNDSHPEGTYYNLSFRLVRAGPRPQEARNETH